MGYLILGVAAFLLGIVVHKFGIKSVISDLTEELNLTKKALKEEILSNNKLNKKLSDKDAKNEKLIIEVSDLNRKAGRLKRDLDNAIKEKCKCEPNSEDEPEVEEKPKPKRKYTRRKKQG